MSTTHLPIVFLPGMLCDERLWSHQVRELSSLSPVLTLPLTRKKSFDEMIAIRDEIPYSRFILAGFSMGGYVSQEIAVRGERRIAHLVLIGVSGSGLTETERRARVIARNWVKKGMYKGISDRQIRSYLHPDSYADPGLSGLIREMSASNTAEMYLNQLNATLDRRDLHQELGSLDFPVTIIGGAQDQVVPPDRFLNLHRAVPGSRLHILERCGHFVPIEKPAELTAILKEVVLSFPLSESG